MTNVYLSQLFECDGRSIYDTNFQLCLSSSCVCSSSSSRPVETSCSTCSATWCPLLPPQLLSLSSSNKDFITQLSQHLSSSVKEQKRKKTKKKEEKRIEERRYESREVPSLVEGTEVGCPR